MTSFDSVTPVDEIFEGLYLGGENAPEYLEHVSIDLHVVCTQGTTPYEGHAERIYHFPMVDEDAPWHTNKLWVRYLVEAADEVARALERNENVLVTCAMGLNRSGLVTALALCRLGYSPRQALKTLRKARSSLVLHNPSFVKVLEIVGPTLS